MRLLLNCLTAVGSITFAATSSTAYSPRPVPPDPLLLAKAQDLINAAGDCSWTTYAADQNFVIDLLAEQLMASALKNVADQSNDFTTLLSLTLKQRTISVINQRTRESGDFRAEYLARELDGKELDAAHSYFSGASGQKLAKRALCSSPYVGVLERSYAQLWAELPAIVANVRESTEVMRKVNSRSGKRP